ncbi:MAG: DUF1080 domain-containing protein [Rhodospirillaceae bacterium]|nr:DUF1080 domain-containing protein [Rhodospirillaceae bacterium]
MFELCRQGPVLGDCRPAIVQHLHIRASGIDHWLNGQLIASATIGNTEWEKRIAESKFSDVPDFGRNAKGRIMLTDHGAEVWYRNLKISSLPKPAKSNAATPK